MTSEYFAPCTLGLEEVLAAELRELEVGDVRPGRGGVTFRADRHGAYAANLWLRSAIRVQELLARGRVRGPKELYRFVASLDWSRFMTVNQTLAVDASLRDEELRHSQYAAQVVKDAIVDQWRERTQRRPSVNRRLPDLPLKLVVIAGRAALYRNLSGPSLHKRGWRPIQVKAPLNEALAAGLLLLCGWDRRSPLVDPMCGSGTFLIEAAHMACDRAPGLNRIFPFERWPDLDGVAWSRLREEAKRRVQSSAKVPIEGADRHAGSISLARLAARSAGVSDLVQFQIAALDRFRPASQPGLVITNPPYGKRLGDGEGLVDSWRSLGGFLKNRCPGAEACILSGDRELTRHLGLRAERRWPVMNGPIECRLIRYQINAEPGQVSPIDTGTA